MDQFILIFPPKFAATAAQIDLRAALIVRNAVPDAERRVRWNSKRDCWEGIWDGAEDHLGREVHQIGLQSAQQNQVKIMWTSFKDSSNYNLSGLVYFTFLAKDRKLLIIDKLIALLCLQTFPYILPCFKEVSLCLWPCSPIILLKLFFVFLMYHKTGQLSIFFNTSTVDLRTDLFLRVFETETAELVFRYTDVIGTLAYSNVTVSDASKNEKSPPEGCAIITVSNHCTAHLFLRGNWRAAWPAVGIKIAIFSPKNAFR